MKGGFRPGEKSQRSVNHEGCLTRVVVAVATANYQENQGAPERGITH